MVRTFCIWALALMLAVISTTTALGAISKKLSPELAASVQPSNGFALAETMSNKIRATVQKNQGVFPDEFDSAYYDEAIRAFEKEPTASGAVMAIALFQPNSERREIMSKAHTLSRRQTLVTGWMIADSGARRDIDSILSHYDVMLRTSSSISGVVIPVMANALGDEDFVEPFASMLESKPPWADAFWSQVVRRPDLIINALKLRQFLYSSTEAVGAFRDGALIDELVQNSHFEKAENHYNLITKTTNKSDLIRNGNFQTQGRYPPFDWRVYSTGEYGAAIEGAALNLSAIQNSGGLFVRQLVKLPRDMLELTIKFDTTIPNNAALFFEISCAERVEDPPKAIRLPLSGETFQRTINNTSNNCAYHWLDINGRSTSDSSGFDVRIEKVTMTNL